MAALTTIFTPPASCSSLITWDGSLFWQGGIFQTNDPSCYPDTFKSILYSYYSPGLCPYGWTSAGSRTGPGDGVNTVESIAMCCPKGYKVQFTEPVPGSKGMYCQTSFSGVLTNVYSTSFLGDGSAPDNPPLQTLTAADISPAVGWQDVIQVRWASTDTDILSIMASTSSDQATTSPISSTNGPAATLSIASSTSAAVPLSTTSSQIGLTSNRMSGGIIAGIIIGAIASGVALFMLGFFIGLKRRRPQIQDIVQRSPRIEDVKYQLHGDSTIPNELGHHEKQPVELNAWTGAQRISTS